MHFKKFVLVFLSAIALSEAGYNLKPGELHKPKDAGYYYCSKANCVSIYLKGGCTYTKNNCKSTQYIADVRFGVDAQNLVSHGYTCTYQSCNGR